MTLAGGCAPTTVDLAPDKAVTGSYPNDLRVEPLLATGSSLRIAMVADTRERRGALPSTRAQLLAEAARTACGEGCDGVVRVGVGGPLNNRDDVRLNKRIAALYAWGRPQWIVPQASARSYEATLRILAGWRYSHRVRGHSHFWRQPTVQAHLIGLHTAVGRTSTARARLAVSSGAPQQRLSNNCGPNDWEAEVESEVVSGSVVEPVGSAEGSEAATGREPPPSVTEAIFRQPQPRGAGTPAGYRKPSIVFTDASKAGAQMWPGAALYVTIQEGSSAPAFTAHSAELTLAPDAGFATLEVTSHALHLHVYRVIDGPDGPSIVSTLVQSASRPLASRRWVTDARLKRSR